MGRGVFGGPLVQLVDLSKDAPDVDLIQSIRSGSRTSAEHLVGRHLPKLLVFLRVLGTPDHLIEDLAQEAFMKALSHLHQFDDNRSFSGWLFGIARNTLFDAKRRYHRELQARSRIIAEPPPPPIDELALAAVSVEALLASIGDEERLLIELRVFQHMPFSEIAELFGEAEPTLRTRMHRLLKKLRAGLTSEENHGR